MMDSDVPVPVFTQPKVRALVTWGFLFSILLGIVMAGLQPFLGSRLNDALWPMLIYIVLFGSLAVWLVQRFRQEGIELQFVVGPRPNRSRWWVLVGLVLVVLAFSLSSFLVSTAALSATAPRFVERLLQQMAAEAKPQTAHPLLFQVVNAIAILVVAPITEELIFRGFILQRWAVKWNLPLALVVSSLVFGLLHLNPVGLSMFGLVMGVLYVKTRSLLVPMAAHAFNNLLAFGSALLPQDPTPTTLKTLYASLPAGLVSLLISGTCLVWFLSKNFPRRDVSIPYVANAQRQAMGDR